MAMYSLDNVLIGFLLVKWGGERGLEGLILLFVAMALKFVVNDHALHQAHQRDYDRIGRWLLVVAILVGWAAGWALPVSGVVTALLEAFVAGEAILGVLNEELPSDRQVRVWAFALGVVAYGALLLALAAGR